MRYEEDGTDKPEKVKFKDHPNWKMVSKNRKQWMEKKFFRVKYNYPDGRFNISFGW